MKIRLSLDDAKARAIWDAITQARAEVERWPLSKRGLDGPPYDIDAIRSVEYKSIAAARRRVEATNRRLTGQDRRPA